MDETRDYLDHFARAIADVRTCTIIARNDDDTYQIRDISSRSIDRASKNSAEEYPLRSRVTVEYPSNSRNTIGALPVITGRAPREQRGLSATSPTEERTTRPAPPTIISIDPNPLVLEAGGEAAEHTITGLGFTSAAEYIASGDGDDPDLTNEDSPSVAPSKVVMTIRADLASPRGSFDVEVDGAVAKNALVIRYRRKPSLLFAWNSDMQLAVYDPETLRLMDTLPADEGETDGLVEQVGDVILGIVRDGATNTIHSFDMATGRMGDPVTIVGASFNNELAVNVGERVWVAANDGTAIIRIALDGSTSILASPADLGTFPVIGRDEDAVFVSARDSTESGGSEIWRYDLAAETSIVAALPAGLPGLNTYIAITSDAVWLIGYSGANNTRRLLKFDAATLANVLNLTMAFAKCYLAYSGGVLFACESNATNTVTTISTVHQGTGAFTALHVINEAFSVNGMAASEDAVFIVDGLAGKVIRLENTDPFPYVLESPDEEDRGLGYPFISR